MSIYRRTDFHPSFDLDVKTPSQAPAEATKATAATTAGFDWRTQRAAEPATALLKPTFSWASTLPIDVQPRALLYKFPRIANLIAAIWHDPKALKRYVDDLLVDKRGGRRGFPVEVLREIFMLRDYYDQIHPHDSAPWTGVVR